MVLSDDEAYEYYSNTEVDGSHKARSNRGFGNKVVAKMEQVEKECPICVPILFAVVAGVVVYQLFLKQPPQYYYD